MQQASLDFSPGIGSPFDDFLRNDKDLRTAILQVISLTLLGLLLTGGYYVYSILEPFIVPLFWAFLTGQVIHPYKRSVTTKTRQYLVRLEKDEKLFAISILESSVKSVDKLAEFVGDYFIAKWKVVITVISTTTMIYITYSYIPDALFLMLGLLWDFLLISVPAFFESVQLEHVIIGVLLSFSSFLLMPNYKRICQIISVSTWTVMASFVLNFLWTPLLYIGAVILIIGYMADCQSEDNPDGAVESDSRFKSFIFSALQRMNILQANAIDDNEKDSKTDKGHLPAGQPAKIIEEEAECFTSTPKQEPKLLKGAPAVIQHPGVSALKKEHGVLNVRQNVSDLSLAKSSAAVTSSTPRAGSGASNSFLGAGGTPIPRGVVGTASMLGANTPRSRIGKSFRYHRRKYSLQEIHHNSMRYIYWALWCCGLIQLWLHPSLLHFLPGPIIYCLLKRLIVYMGVASFVMSKISEIHKTINHWISEREDIVLPSPVKFILRALYRVERMCLQGTISHMDSLVTALLLLAMMLLLAAASLITIIQVYAESAYILQSVSSIATSLHLDNSSSSYLSSLNISLNSDTNGMEGVMDEAYNYGRTWISSTLQEYLKNADSEVKVDLEMKVLELWDRSYQYWVQRQDSSGPRVDKEAVAYSFGELFEKLYEISSPDIFNISSLQVFLRNNMGTLTSITERIWTLVQGNFVFITEAMLGILRVLLYSSSGFLNFLFSIVIYITALFYLLSNSTISYKPVEVISQYSIFSGYGVGSALQTAVNSVLFITLKMASFYLLWTYLTHTLFQATIVVLPMLASSFIAAVPFTGQYLVSVPASLELWFLQDRPVPAVLLMIFQVLPSWFVDATIYSEVKGGIHPWFTGLAVVGGVYLFGVVGAVYGPLALCVLYVGINTYSAFIQDTEPATPLMQRSLRATLHRSDTVQ